MVDKLLKNRDCFLTEGDFEGRSDLGSLEAEETVVTSDLSLRLKREAKRRILERVVRSLTHEPGGGGEMKEERKEREKGSEGC